MSDEIIYKKIDTDKVEEILQRKKTYSIKEKKDEIKDLEVQRDSITFLEIPLIEKSKKVEPLDDEDILYLINEENNNRELIKAEIENQIKQKVELLEKLEIAK